MSFCVRPLRAFLGATSALLPLAVHAQEASQLPQVDVEAGTPADAVASAPVTGRTLSEADIRRLQLSTSDTAALLRWIPGVSANSGGGFSSMPVIRGLNEQRLRITVDGSPIDFACPNDMNSPLSYTDPSRSTRSGSCPASRRSAWVGTTSAGSSPWKAPRRASPPAAERC
ncbi:TonB-dependent receptor plug domain-containing protein [Novosphingobium sp. NBM11]|uniref:TonB-dependent receptor plug domain-containing protein n=1 Tax=Novosphingobium sp. NBM11 TaxID=2596914 RepID=UPI002105D0A5|nr:TonB-dependent receptor plug domain-containing protein [Novosphingobium sp. NBM11]